MLPPFLSREVVAVEIRVSTAGMSSLGVQAITVAKAAAMSANMLRPLMFYSAFIPKRMTLVLVPSVVTVAVTASVRGASREYS